MPDAETFPGVDRPVPVPARPAWRKRLPYLTLAAVNRLVPKVATKVVLHSTVDVEDGVLAVAEELAARGQRAT
ncbi:MAG: hypothetical protein M3P93_16925, partial [Actinomycetota bacterium]|nr:hypothetical protein [Actinomycetota bacterium]